MNLRRRFKFISQQIASVILTWAVMVSERIQGQWDGLSGIYGEAQASVDNTIVFPTYLLQRLEFFGEKCWVCEYGSGSASDTMDNPYIDDYINDSNFNDYRSKSDMTIRGCDAGDYTDLDGNIHQSSGANAGKDLEAKPVYPGMTMLPMHIIREEVHSALPELYSMINDVVADEVMSGLGITLKMYV